jgi:hypothetical protein
MRTPAMRGGSLRSDRGDGSLAQDVFPLDCNYAIDGGFCIRQPGHSGPHRPFEIFEVFRQEQPMAGVPNHPASGNSSAENTHPLIPEGTTLSGKVSVEKLLERLESLRSDYNRFGTSSEGDAIAGAIAIVHECHREYPGANSTPSPNTELLCGWCLVSIDNDASVCKNCGRIRMSITREYYETALGKPVPEKSTVRRSDRE